ncbi:hypothetical protein ACFE04_013291 [Oxalis oulophora]
MPVEENANRNVLVAIKIDGQGRELLNWALVKVAEPGDCVVAIHVCSCSNEKWKNKLQLDAYLEVYQGLCSMKKVNLKGRVLTGRSVRKILVSEANNSKETIAVVLGISKQSTLGISASRAKYCARRLAPTTDVLAIHNGKIFYQRLNNNRQPGLRGDPRPSFHSMDSLNFKDFQSEYSDSDYGGASTSGLKNERRYGSLDLKDETLSLSEQKCLTLRNTCSAIDILDQRPGWPLQTKHAHARSMSVVQWVLNLPDRSPHLSPRCASIAENPEDGDLSYIMYDNLCDVPNSLEILLKSSSSGWICFGYEELKTATSNFSSENLTGKGGCNRVYKGRLPDGKQIAVKILKSSKEAWKDFTNEVEIMSSLNNKQITHLLGICIEDNNLISVYNFLSKGSLEENLHKCNGKGQSVFSWEQRYNVAIRIAEALNYLHNECSRPVIHRDVKSSNILFTDNFEPQLSDFGMALWGPTISSFLIECDVVGTFGYLAPEYFMYGKVSDKIDVYAFGVVLLELLSGRKPIDSDAAKGQESLVMWAKPIIENGDINRLTDPNFDGKFNKDQMQRVVLAATLCIRTAARLRPGISEILKLLNGDADVDTWVKCKNNDQEDPKSNDDDDDDEVYPNSISESHLGLAFHDVVDDDDRSSSNVERSNTTNTTITTVIQHKPNAATRRQRKEGTLINPTPRHNACRNSESQSPTNRRRSETNRDLDRNREGEEGDRGHDYSSGVLHDF